MAINITASERQLTVLNQMLWRVSTLAIAKVRLMPNLRKPRVN